VPIYGLVSWSVFQLVWPVLAVLAFLLARTVVMILHMHHFKAVDVHMRIKQCRELRHQYLASIDSDAAGQENVDIVE